MQSPLYFYFDSDVKPGIFDFEIISGYVKNNFTCYYCSQNYALSKAVLNDIFDLDISDGGPAIEKTQLWVLHFRLVCSLLAPFKPRPNNTRAARGFSSCKQAYNYEKL